MSFDRFASWCIVVASGFLVFSSALVFQRVRSSPAPKAPQLSQEFKRSGFPNEVTQRLNAESGTVIVMSTKCSYCSKVLPDLTLLTSGLSADQIVFVFPEKPETAKSFLGSSLSRFQVVQADPSHLKVSATPLFAKIDRNRRVGKHIYGAVSGAELKAILEP
jgi:hypothetical protein